MKRVILPFLIFSLFTGLTACSKCSEDKPAAMDEVDPSADIDDPSVTMDEGMSEEEELPPMEELPEDSSMRDSEIDSKSQGTMGK